MTQPEIPLPQTAQNSGPDRRKDRRVLWLFLLSLAVYLLTRLIRLPDFPIYFFTDEAIQTQQAADLVTRGFFSADGVFLPTYFQNGGQYNLSLSVYAQVIPTLLFGKSVWVTRGTSVLLSLIATVSLGMTLKHSFHSQRWWLGPLLLAALPAWFLHSRTAFETVLMASLFAGFLYFYLRYRDGHPKALFASLTLGALAFYAYSPGQVIMVITGLMLLIADARYHWRRRKTALLGLGLLIVLALPYLRFSTMHAGERLHHLTQLNSYWVKPGPLYEKIGTYLTRYFKGLNPFYWFWPNPSFLEKLWPQVTLPSWLFSAQGDLARHTMKGYGHILPIFFPFWLAGLVRCIRRFRDPAHRTLILATLAAPSGAALVDWGITRGLVFIIPAVLTIALGIEMTASWLRRKWPKLRERQISAFLFLTLAGFSFWMLGGALRNGPTWYDEYGLGGMQYGAAQVFTRAAEIARSEPQTTVLVSSTWANGTDVLLRYFADDLDNLMMGNINAWALTYQPLDERFLFVMTQEDLDFIYDSDKFKDVWTEEILPYPDGSPGFYFVRLAYVDDIQAVLAAEREARQTLVTETLNIMGQPVAVAYSALDMNEIAHAFDGDPLTVIRTLEANPLRVVLTFPESVEIQSVRLWIGGPPTLMSLTAFLHEEKLDTVLKEVGQANIIREIPLTFNQVVTVDQLQIEIRSTDADEIAHVHLWEVVLE
ncbi:MAG: glycosyltransferase family 39 protein [Chloroflexota bacterium]|nr:glycosyltransferase family 39 protein [Chloroflexota bacterium]